MNTHTGLESEMAAISVADTLGELVTTDPSLARELERFGLDYCCGGGKTIAEACSTRGLDPAAVAADLEAARVVAPPAEWSSMGAAELVDHIEATHHRYLWTELPRLSALADKVLAAHGHRHPELGQVSDLEPHLMKEERVLFPMIRELGQADRRPMFHCGTVRNPIAVMTVEHEQVGALLAHLRGLTDDYSVPPDGCRSYSALYAALAELEEDTHLHVHKENNVLFPAVERIEAQLSL